MKYIVILFAVVMSGCGVSNFEIVSTSQQLVASKSYLPSLFSDAVAPLSKETFECEVPQELSVYQGNAGNHTAVIRFNQVLGEISCTYRGGSSQSNPNSQAQYDLGLKYILQSCVATGGAAAPNGRLVKLAANDTDKVVSLRINNGATNFGPTGAMGTVVCNAKVEE